MDIISVLWFLMGAQCRCLRSPCASVGRLAINKLDRDPGMSGDKLQPVLIPMLEKIFRSCALLIACPFDSPRSVKPKELLRFLHVEIGSEKAYRKPEPFAALKKR